MLRQLNLMVVAAVMLSSGSSLAAENPASESPDSVGPAVESAPAVVAPANPVSSGGTRFELGVGIGMNIAPDSAQQFFTDSPLAWKLGVSAVLDFRVGHSWHIGPVLGYTGHRQEFQGPLVDAALSEVSHREIEAGVRVSRVLVPGIELSLRLLGGPSFRRVVLYAGQERLGASVDFARQEDVSLFADAQLAAALYFPKKWLRSGRVVPGMALSAGYRFRPSLTLEPATLEDEDSGVTLRGPSLGDVNYSGFAWSWGLFVRFR